MGFLDLYRSPKPPADEQEVEKEELEPLPKLSWSEFWPPSPRVKILYIGMGFFLLNMILLIIFVVVWVTNN